MNTIPRRDFLKMAGAALASLPLAGISLAQNPGAPRRPNILVFLTDDHGQWAQHVNGNSELVTPNMDRIAAMGTRMTQAFTPSPVCSPARACFFTGRMPSQHGIHEWLPEAHGANPYLNLTGQVLISDLLKQAGYYTGLVGKWHCGNEWEPQSGFDYWFSYWKGQYPHLGAQQFSDQGKLLVTAPGQQSPFLTERAIEFLRQHRTTDGAKEKPFFLFVGYVDTHLPHNAAPDDLVKQYESATFRDIPEEDFPACHGRALHPGKKSLSVKNGMLAEYYAAVSSVDREVGKVLAELEASGELANTLIVYTSDHGLNTCHHGMWEKGNATVPQNFLEESTRVSCAVSWPAGGIRQNATCDDLVNHCDLWATLLDVAAAAPNAKDAEQINSPGVSYLPQLLGKPASWRKVVIGEYGNARMARTARYKLIKRYPFEGKTYADELYDLQVDPRETTNRFADASLADVIQNLTGEIDRFFSKYTIPGRSGLDLEHQPQPYSAPPWGQKKQPA